MSEMTIEPLAYMQRSKDFYAAQGFTKPYAWPQQTKAPLHVLDKTISQARVTFITTAVPFGDIPKASRGASSHRIADIPATFRTDELSWDKQATHTRDRGSYIPLEPLQALANEGVIGELAQRFHFLPTEYSQRNTLEKDAPLILAACQADAVDIAILVPL